MNPVVVLNLRTQHQTQAQLNGSNLCVVCVCGPLNQPQGTTHSIVKLGSVVHNSKFSALTKMTLQVGSLSVCAAHRQFLVSSKPNCRRPPTTPPSPTPTPCYIAKGPEGVTERHLDFLSTKCALRCRSWRRQFMSTHYAAATLAR